MNTIASPGTSKLVMLKYQDRKLHGWVLETETDQKTEYEVYIALTGEVVPHNYCYAASTQTEVSGGYYVVHAFD
jgi:hypothetical protein